MKNLKNNIEQTCIEFGKYVANNYAPQTPVDIIKGMWGHFQEQQAKEVMDILDDIQSNDKSDDLYTIDGLDDNGIGEPVCEDFNKHFASKQVEINREIIQTIKESSEMHDDIFMKIHNIIKLLHDRISDNTSLIKTVSNITSANEIALNHLEENDSYMKQKDEKCKQYDTITESDLVKLGFIVRQGDEFIYFTYNHNYIEVDADIEDGKWKVLVYDIEDEFRYITSLEELKEFIKNLERITDMNFNNSKPTDQYEDKTRVGGLSPSEKMARNIKWCEEILLKPKHTTRTGGLGETGPRN